MHLYVYKGYKGGPERQQETDSLIMKAAECFIREMKIEANGLSREIIRSDKGKPSFRELPIKFSVSHSSDFWVCLITGRSESVGVDIQIVKNIRMDRIMERYFTEDEKLYVKNEGDYAFFQIWTRKEAFAKYTGRGLNRELSAVSTLKNNEVVFVDFDISDGVKGSCCVKEKGELCLRTI